MSNSRTLPDQDITRPTGEVENIPLERQPPILQETHPSTASHDPGDLGRAAISESGEEGHGGE